MNHAPLRRLLTAVAAAGIAVAVLTSCSGQPDLERGVAAQLQTRVAAAKQLAAQQDYPAALSELDQLSQDVATAAGQGRVSEQRRSRIEAAIGTIRTDLAAAQAPPPSPAAPATEPQLTEEQKKQAEKAREEAEEQREEAQKEAEKKREEAQKEAEKKRSNG